MIYDSFISDQQNMSLQTENPTVGGTPTTPETGDGQPKVTEPVAQ